MAVAELLACSYAATVEGSCRDGGQTTETIMPNGAPACDPQPSPVTHLRTAPTGATLNSIAFPCLRLTACLRLAPGLQALIDCSSFVQQLGCAAHRSAPPATCSRPLHRRSDHRHLRSGRPCCSPRSCSTAATRASQEVAATRGPL